MYEVVIDSWIVQCAIDIVFFVNYFISLSCALPKSPLSKIKSFQVCTAKQDHRTRRVFLEVSVNSISNNDLT